MCDGHIHGGGRTDTPYHDHYSYEFKHITNYDSNRLNAIFAGEHGFSYWEYSWGDWGRDYAYVFSTEKNLETKNGLAYVTDYMFDGGLNYEEKDKEEKKIWEMIR